MCFRNSLSVYLFSSSVALLVLFTTTLLGKVTATELVQPTPTLTTPAGVLATGSNVVVRSIFLPYNDDPGLGAVVLSVGTGYTAYAIECMTDNDAPTPAPMPGCSLQGTIVVTEGPGTFIATLTPMKPIKTPTVIFSTDSDTTSGVSPAVTGTTVACTFRNRPAASRTNAVYSKLPIATSTTSPSVSQVPGTSSAALDATWVSAVCIVQSTIAELGVAVTTTTIFGSTMENYGSATITITAGAAKLTSPPTDFMGSDNGTVTSSGDAAIGAVNRFTGTKGDVLGMIGILFGVLGVFGL